MKITISILLFILIFRIDSFSQNQFNLEWSENDDASIFPATSICVNYYNKECSKVRLDTDENVIVAATTYENNNYDFIILKYSNDGNLIWKKVIDYNNLSEDKITDIHIDSNNNIFILGESILDNGSKVVFIKLDSQGNTIFIKNYSDNYDYAEPRKMVFDNSGNSYITGLIKIFDDFLWNDYFFIVKLNTNGDFVWENLLLDNNFTYNSFNINIVNDTIFTLGSIRNNNPTPSVLKVLIQKHDLNGNLYNNYEIDVEQMSISSSHIDHLGNCYLGFFSEYKIKKFNIFGIEDWTVSIPSNLPSNINADELRFITTDEDLNVYTTGRYYGENYGDTLSYTNGDILTLKLSSSGGIVYSHLYNHLGTHGYEGGNHLFVDNNGNVAVAGQSQKYNTWTEHDFVAIVLDPLGNEVDIIRYGDDDVEEAKSIHMDNDLNLYITGIGSAGSLLTQKYSFYDPVGINNTISNEKIKIYPNPFLTDIYIENEDNKFMSFQLFNVNGKLIINKEFNDSMNNIKIKKYLVKGIYFYRIKTNSKIITGKLIKN